MSTLSVNGHEDEVLFDKCSQFLVMDKKFDPQIGMNLIQLAQYP